MLWRIVHLSERIIGDGREAPSPAAGVQRATRRLAAQALPTLTPRRVFGRVRFPGKATAVVGMRRSGKTTFLHQLRQERIEQGVPRQQLPYVSFEDERLADLDAAGLDLLVSEYGREFPDADDAADPSQPMSRTAPSAERMEKWTLPAFSDQPPGGSRSEPSSAMFGNA